MHLGNFCRSFPVIRHVLPAVLLVGLLLTPERALAHTEDTSLDGSSSTRTGLSTPPVSLSEIEAGQTCQEMTDSLVRLYDGYFNRKATPSEFDAIVEKYRSGIGLKQLSQELLESSEFATDNGKLSDSEFIDLVFDNTVQREPSDAEQTQWEQSLPTDGQRALMMIAFTESEEFVQRTQTARPLAGYSRWYPNGLHWYCGRGSDRFPIQPLTGQKVSSDFIFVNSGVQPSMTELWVLEANFNRNVQMTSGAIPPDFTDFNWDGLFSGDGNYGENLDVKASDSTRWIVVFYPTSIGDKRSGWELEPT